MRRGQSGALRQAAQAAMVAGIFDDRADAPTRKTITDAAAQLAAAQKRVRRTLDQGAARADGAVLKKALAALTAAQDVIKRVA